MLFLAETLNATTLRVKKKTEEEKENANLLSFQNLNAFFNVLKSYHPRISKLKLKLKL